MFRWKESSVHLYRCTASILLCTILYGAVDGSAASQYTVTDLDTFLPSALAGPWVVGTEHALPVRLNLNAGERSTLEHLGYGGAASAVLASGESVGWVWRLASNCCLLQNAAFWNAQGTLLLLSHPPGIVESVATGLNASFTVVGNGNVTESSSQAVRWWPHGTAEVVDGSGGLYTSAVGVDGYSRAWGNVLNKARVWDETGMLLEVGDLGNAPPSSSTGAVNHDAVGVGESYDPETNAYVPWRHRLGVEFATMLPKLSTSFPSCLPRSINGVGDAVGQCARYAESPAAEVLLATLWPVTGGIIDLNRSVMLPPDLVLEHARGISDEGRIVGLMGQGHSADTDHGFLLTPLPPSASVALHVNQTTFGAGQTLHAELRVQNPRSAVMNLYVGVVLPDGDQLMLFTNLSPLTGTLTSLTSNPRRFPPLLLEAELPATLTLQVTHTFSGAEPPGVYHVIAALTPPGAFDDGQIDDGDLLAFTVEAFSVTAGPTGLEATRQAIRSPHVR
jgi:hypothetical protein